MIPEGPLLWYLNRSTGLVLLALLTLTVLLGSLSTRGHAGTWMPRFVVQALHRNLALLSTVLLALHVVTAVLDEFVDIRWWQAFAPWDLHYEPLWLALGILAFDLFLAAVLTSLLRHRLEHRAWWLVHVTTYAAWLLSVVHGLGIGTDTGDAWARWTYVGCAVVVALATLLRLTGQAYQRGRTSVARGPSTPLTEVGGGR